MSRKEILQEMRAYCIKTLHKSEDTLRKHHTGIWAPSPEFVNRAEVTVQKWIRWRDLIEELIAECTD
jgi:hypothetical protein